MGRQEGALQGRQLRMRGRVRWNRRRRSRRRSKAA
jgi:hypothetical protein